MTKSVFELNRESKSVVEFKKAVGNLGSCAQAFAMDQIKVLLIDPKFNVASHDDLVDYIIEGSESLTRQSLKKQISNFRAPLLWVVKKLATAEELKHFKSGKTSRSLTEWFKGHNLGKSTCEKLKKALLDMDSITKDLDVSIVGEEVGNARICLQSAEQHLKTLEKFSEFEAVEKARQAAQDAILRTKEVDALEIAQEAQATTKAAEVVEPSPTGEAEQEVEQEAEPSPTGEAKEVLQMEPVKMTSTTFTAALSDLITKALDEGIEIDQIQHILTDTSLALETLKKAEKAA